MTHFSDGRTELLIRNKEKDETLMVGQVWTYMGATPFEDGDTNDTIAPEATHSSSE